MSLDAGAPVDAGGGVTLPPAHWLAWVVAIVLAVGTIVLLALRINVPSELWALDTAVIVGGAALTPTNGGSGG